MESPLTATASSSSDASKITIVAANATVLYLLAYLLTQGTYQLATLMRAARLGIRGEWQLSQGRFHVADAEWWRLAVGLLVLRVGLVVGWRIVLGKRS